MTSRTRTPDYQCCHCGERGKDGMFECSGRQGAWKATRGPSVVFPCDNHVGNYRDCQIDDWQIEELQPQSKLQRDRDALLAAAKDARPFCPTWAREKLDAAIAAAEAGE